MSFQPIKIVDVELSEPIAGQGGLQGYAGLHGLVRLHGAPLGWVRLPVINGAVSAGAISRAVLEQFAWPIVRHLVADGLAAPLGPQGLEFEQLLSQPHPQYGGPWPSVTVAVCTRERPDDLARCLEALTQLDYPNLELLVIDNAPKSEATHAVVARFPGVRYVREPRPGLDWARNRAIAEATSEIIAYTDDDVIVDRGWVRALAQVFAEASEVQAVTGLVVPYELESESQLLFEQYGGFGRGFERKWYRSDPLHGRAIVRHFGWTGMFGTGANMAYRRGIFEQIGPFDPALDVGTPTNGGGDIEMFFRLLKAGHALVYEPSALVRHRHRRDRASLHRQIANNGVGFSAYMVCSALAHPDERLAFARMWLRWLRNWHLRRVYRSLKGTEKFPRAMVVAELWGYFVGLGRYRKAQDRAAQVAAAHPHLSEAQ